MTFMMNSCGSDNDVIESEDELLIGNIYQYYEEWYNEFTKTEVHQTTIEFLSSTSCEVHAWGYSVTLGKEVFNETKTLLYSVSGDEVSI